MGILEDELEREPRGAFILPRILAELGELERGRGYYDRALSLYEQAEEALPDDWSENENHVLSRLVVCGYRGQAHLEIGHVDQAARWLEEERELASRFGAREIAISLAHLANLYTTNESYGLVLETVDEALRIPAVAENPTWLGDFLVRKGSALSELERAAGASTSEAVGVLEDALAIEALSEIERTRCEIVLADTLMRIRELEEAARIVGRARERLQELPEAIRHPMTGLAIHADTVLCELALARSASKAELERVRAILETSFREFLAGWAALPPRKGGVGFLGAGSHRDALSELIALSVAIDDTQAGYERALGYTLEAQALGTLTRELGVGTTDLDDLRASLLTDGSGILLYYAGTNRSHVFCIDAERITIDEIRDEDALQPANRALLSYLAFPPGSFGADDARRHRRAEIERLAGELAEELLPPSVQETLRSWEHVYLVGNELLGNIPFEALPLAGGGLFGHELAVSHLPSLPLGRHLERIHRARSERFEARGVEENVEFALLAAPEHGERAREAWPSLRTLPLTAPQIERLVAPFDRVLPPRSGPEATFEAFTELSAQEPAILEILAHGVREPERERAATLLLAETSARDGFLRAGDVEPVPTAPLVVLLACGAGEGAVRRGDDRRTDLGGAFLAAGAQSVILGRTDMELSAVLSLAEPLHRALAEGVASAEALRRARVATAADPATEDPFYHALIQVVGLGARPVLPPRPIALASQGAPDTPDAPSPIWIAAAIGGAVLAIAAWWLGRRRGSAR